MNKAWLMAAPLGAALLLGGWQLWPNSAPPRPLPGARGRAELPLARQAASSPDENSLQARYEAFLAAEGSLTVPTDPGLASLQVLFDEREQLRQQSFTPAEQEQLFAEDRLMEQWTLRRKALAEAGDADKPLLASELELWLAEQPQWFQEAEANSRLLGDLQSLERLPATERDAVLREQLGPEAADRLHQLTESQQGSSSSWPAIWPNSSLCPPSGGPNSSRRSWRAGSSPTSGDGWRPSPGSGWASRHRNK